jgi:hypothetical protein
MDSADADDEVSLMDGHVSLHGQLYMNNFQKFKISVLTFSTATLQLKSRSVALRLTVSRPVSPGVKPHLGPKTRFLLLSDICGPNRKHHFQQFLYCGFTCFLPRKCVYRPFPSNSHLFWLLAFSPSASMSQYVHTNLWTVSWELKEKKNVIFPPICQNINELVWIPNIKCRIPRK